MFVYEIPGDIIVMKEEDSFEYSGSPPGGRAAAGGSLIYGYGPGKEIPGYFRSKTPDSTKSRKVPDIRVNCRIVHDKFGGGKVLNVEKETALIRFDNGTTMRLLLQYAPIKIESGAC
jgi:hypothetical protein